MELRENWEPKHQNVFYIIYKIVYDLLEGIEKVKNIYYYMIITKKGPEELFKETITIIEKIKADDK